MMVPAQIIAILDAPRLRRRASSPRSKMHAVAAARRCTSEHKDAAEPPAAGPLLRAVRPHRGLRHRSSTATTRCARPAAVGVPPPVLRDAHRRRGRPRRRAPATSARSSAAGRSRWPATTAAPTSPRQATARRLAAAPATWATSTRTASCTSSTARRT
ncbi:MAG: hypothetical protein MZW92_32965 [Comamonadaceae bacterium]|nr:hypothetical protein [Comamonadaceae bacterium]